MKIFALATLSLLICPLIAEPVSHAAPSAATQSGKGPVKVFILAGQSNMEGQGFIGGAQKGTLETLTKDLASVSYTHLTLPTIYSV